MPNGNNLPHRNGEDDDQSSDEGEPNSTRTRSIYIVVVVVLITSVEQPTPLSQPATDERTTDPQELTNQQIDRLIENHFDHIETTTLMAYCFIFLLFCFIFYQCWPLLIFMYAVYQLITNNNHLSMNSRESQHSNLLLHHMFDPFRDAAAEGRTAHPTEEGIRLSDTVEIFVPYGIQAVPVHDIAAHADLNNIPNPIVITNNENDNGGIIGHNIQNEANLQVTTNEDNLTNSNDQTVQTSPIIENIYNPIQNNVEINQINAADRQPVALRNEATEIVANVAAPADGAHQVILPPSVQQQAFLSRK